MAVRRESRREHNPVKARRREAKRRAAKLAPPEERNQEGRTRADGDGALGVDTGELKLPESLLAETEAAAESSFHLDPIVIFILACALAYIALIVYLISSGRAQ
ncbi:MAG TPA: hypothetical protein VF544_08390 [Pyrinomonadaceae bacterium]|jgi:hypothetical protein